MNNTINSTASKLGQCPHGMPPSACPICSNMGGGSRKSRLDFKLSPPPMMSWNKCEAIGYFLKSQKRAAENNRMRLKMLALNIALYEDKTAKLATRLEALAAIFNQTLIGSLFAVPIKFAVLPVVNVLQTSIAKFADAGSIVAAVWGEMQMGLKKAKENIEKFIKEVKNKFFKLFEIFGTQKSGENDKKFDEAKKIFNIKQIILKLLKNRAEKKHET